ncbi:MAG: family 78 glycoside hydrolase catalytic domain, partial [Bacteroidota bacterium]|nr:family 78 glycoside hydrolase catalytic domain [Bacteroidota bacterium]
MKRIMFFLTVFSMITIYHSSIYGKDFKKLSSIHLTGLRCEYRVNPLGIDVHKPRLSWIIDSDERGQKQNFYQVLVATSKEQLAKNEGDIWDSDKIDSDQSVHVIYKGKRLESQMQCFWKVRVWDKDGNPSPWSKPAMWTMGLLESSDWTAQWIGLDMPETNQRNDFQFSKWIWFPGGNPAEMTSPGTRYFRRLIVIPENHDIINAQYLITADNRFSLYVNGKLAGKGDKVKERYKFDVSGLLQTGKNILAVTAINRGPEDNSAGLIGVLRIESQQGDTLIVPMDRQWNTFSKEIPGWKNMEFDDSGWIAAQELGDCNIEPWGDISMTEVNTRLPARMLRSEFTILKKVKHAVAYVCGLGFFELHLNGEKVGDHVMDPGLTNYNKRLLYVTFNLTDQLSHGSNTLGAILGNGRFFAPRTSMHEGMRSYGFPKLLFQMHIEYEDGSTQVIVSDENWKLTSDGPIRANNEYDGEEYDARMKQDGWDRQGFDDSEWKNAHLVKPPKGFLQAQMIEPIRVTETIKPIGISKPKSGIYIVDMGQAFYGTFRLKVKGQEGAKVKIRSAYNLKPD